MSQEKRADQRHYMADVCQVVDVQSEQVFGRLVNVSAKGLMLQSNQLIEANCIYTVRFTLANVSMVMGIDCLWCEPSDNPELFWAGFQIVSIMPEHEGLIRQLSSE